MTRPGAQTTINADAAQVRALVMASTRQSPLWAGRRHGPRARVAAAPAWSVSSC